MSQTSSQTGFSAAQGRSESDARTIPIVTFGLALSSFFGVSYIVCILGYLLAPGLPVQHQFLEVFLPGFTLLTWPSFFVGLVESVLLGWYVALLFGWLYNWFACRA